MRQLLLLVRHLIAVLVLPFMMTVMIPRWLIRAYGVRRLWSGTVATSAGYVIGAFFFAVGISLFLWCLYLFAMRGRGTLAPWDPPKKLVVTGPYRYVRNPMISGVLMILLSEALVRRSQTLLFWLLTFFAMNAVHFLIFEEPDLERRFGEDYRRYKKEVPRWIPRLRPWTEDF